MTAQQYAAPVPRRPRRGIGLVGCGWVASMQLAAYRASGYEVVALTDRTQSKAAALRDEYYPAAAVHADVAELLRDDRVEVVDLATHVSGRPELVEAALRAGKDVLSQKPFVLDLDDGERLCVLADDLGRTLAVNHNGRWAPHFAVLLAAARSGRLGTVTSADFWVHWPHDAVVERMPAFSGMTDLVLFDFGIHWFDIVGALLSGEPEAVFAQTAVRAGQRIAAPTQAQVVLGIGGAQVSLRFRAAESRAEEGGYRVDGTGGTARHQGASLGGESVSIITGSSDDEQLEHISIAADWFGPGMSGAMGELLLALDEGRAPTNDGRSSLRGLQLCFAAIESARTGLPVVPGTVRQRPECT